MSHLVQALPAQSAAGAMSTTLIGTVETTDDQGDTLVAVNLTPPAGYTAVAGVATNNVTFNVRQLRAAGTVAAPTGLAVVGSGTGGTLAAGTYYWKVTFVNAQGETVGSNEVSYVASGTTSSGALSWTAAPAGVTNVKVYRGTSAGGENALITTVSGATTSYTDTGTAGSAATVPATNTAGTFTTNTVASVQLVAGTGLIAETSLNVPITNPVSLKRGDVFDVQMVQNGTGLAVGAGVLAQVEVN